MPWRPEIVAKRLTSGIAAANTKNTIASRKMNRSDNLASTQ